MGIAVVTGSASGIGAAVRARLEKNGDRVIGIDLRNAEIEVDLSTPEGRKRSIAQALEACGGSLDGVQVSSPGSIARATIEQAAGPDAILPNPTRFAQGFWLSMDGNMGLNPGNFGHPGAGGSLGFADPDRRIGFGYVMNQMKVGLQGEATTSRCLIDALYTLL